MGTAIERLRTCPVCEVVFRARGETYRYAQRFCSQSCATTHQMAEKRAKWPTVSQMLRMVNVEKLSDAQIGRIYGHSYEWARQVRAAYDIPAVPKPPTRTVTHGRFIGAQGWSVAKKGEDCCRVCRRPAAPGRLGALHLHHLVPRSMHKASRLDLRNGIALCSACHQGWHDRSLTIYRDVLTTAEWDYVSGITLLGQNIQTWLDRNYPARPVRS